MRWLCIAMLAGVYCVALSQPLEASIITIPPDTMAPIVPAGPFGANPTLDNPAIGQVVTVPTGDDLLVSYSLSLTSFFPGTVFAFESRVYEWNPMTLTAGPRVFTSAVQTVTSPGAFTFTPGIAVDSGEQYLFAVVGLAGTNGFMAANNDDPYSGPVNTALVLGTTLNPDTGAWTILRGVDLVGTFEFANSTQVPEPSTFTLMSLSAVGFGGAALRRVQKGRTSSV